MYNCSLCSKEVESLAVRQVEEYSSDFDNKGLCSDCLDLVQYLAMASTAESIEQVLSWYPESWKCFQQKLATFFVLKEVSND